MDEKKVFKDFLLGFVRIHILHHAVEEPIYGLGIIEELAHHGYRISPGTLYPVLHGLWKNGYLEKDERLIDGKIRKYYRATAKGKTVLEDVKPKISELVGEVV